MVMWFDPGRPMYDRYQVRHDFLAPERGFEVVTISRVVNAFFRWEFNSCESIVRGDDVFPIDYANASPDVSLTSLHYYFPWALKALVRWSVYCTVTERQPRYDLETRRYFDIADRTDLDYAEKLKAYRGLADDYFQTGEYEEFRRGPLAHLDEAAHDFFTSDEFDRLLVETVRSTFPVHEHERFLAHYRGLLGSWASERVRTS